LKTLLCFSISLKGGLSDPTLEENCLSKKHPKESSICPVYRAWQGLPEEEGKTLHSLPHGFVDFIGFPDDSVDELTNNTSLSLAFC